MIDALRGFYEAWRILLTKPTSWLDLIGRLVVVPVLTVMTLIFLGALALYALMIAGVIWAIPDMLRAAPGVIWTAVLYIAGSALLAFEQIAAGLNQIPVWAGIIIILLMLILGQLSQLNARRW